MTDSNIQPDPAQQAATQHVDARGLQCPLPLLKMRQALHMVSIGQCVSVLTTDPNSQSDIQRYCERSGQRLMQQWQDAGHFGFIIEKTA